MVRTWIAGKPNPHLQREYILTNLVFVHSGTSQFRKQHSTFVKEFSDRLYNTFAHEDFLAAIRETDSSDADRLGKLKLVLGQFRAVSKLLLNKLDQGDVDLLKGDDGAADLLKAAGYDLTSLFGEVLAHWFIETSAPIGLNAPKKHTTEPGIDFLEIGEQTKQFFIRVWETKTVTGKHMSSHCTDINQFFSSTVNNTLQDTFREVKSKLPLERQRALLWTKDFLPGNPGFHYGAFFVLSHSTGRSPYLKFKDLSAPSLQHRHLTILAFPEDTFAQLKKTILKVGQAVCDRILKDLA